ncbi:DUF2934 domain-containing protein [Bosea sp. AS-1]|jgi:hypothetical protein|uniref:DUF2934 domain-containing protein n=1 Tax=Bosea sp. AS-1 TaxID=2015316 RepID=UPI0012FE6230|nr:DUF2934 domain-containing protein [Bosea sp. AS-1]
MTLSEKSQREIRKIAYAIWMQEGQPEGRDKEHWEAAKEIWAFRSHNHALPDEEDDSKPARSGGGERRQPTHSRPM